MKGNQIEIAIEELLAATEQLPRAYGSPGFELAVLDRATKVRALATLIDSDGHTLDAEALEKIRVIQRRGEAILEDLRCKRRETLAIAAGLNRARHLLNAFAA